MSRYQTVTINGHDYTLDEMMKALDEMAEHLVGCVLEDPPAWAVVDHRG